MCASNRPQNAVEHVELLRIQRNLLDLPRGSSRFQEYLQRLQGSGPRPELELPLSHFNPMSREHVAAVLDRLLAFDAEAVAREAPAGVGALPDRPVRTGLVVCDDVMGGWTDRATTDAAHRFDGRGEFNRGWATALLWASEEPSTELVRVRVKEALFRFAYVEAHGWPRTLGDRLEQVSAVARAAGTVARLDDADRVRAVLDEHRDATDAPTVLACLYGDDAARRLGYDPLGLPPFAGLRFAAGS